MAFANATALLIDYLDLLLDPVPVVSRVPDTRPDAFVQVRRVGGSTLTVRDVARMDVFAWHHADEVEAMTLLLAARTHIWATAGNNLLGVTNYRVQEFLSPRQFNDPVSGTPRAWMTVQLDLRANELIHFSPPPGDES